MFALFMLSFYEVSVLTEKVFCAFQLNLYLLALNNLRIVLVPKLEILRTSSFSENLDFLLRRKCMEPSFSSM